MKNTALEIGSLDSFALARAIRAGDISACEALEASMARIERTNDAVNAFTGKCYARARQEAAAVDALRARGATLPPLAGVPYAVKNLFDVAGEVTLAGSKINRSHAPAAEDAFLVGRMQAAGAVLLGSLNMDEYAYGFTTENTHYGPSHNPHDLSRVAGGSIGWFRCGRGGGAGGYHAGVGHQWLDSCARVAVWRLGLEAHVWPLIKARQLPVCAQHRPPWAAGRFGGQPGAGL